MSSFNAPKNSLFAPPYRYLPFAVFIYFLLCCLGYANGPMHTHEMSDPDDYMRLNQTINWLQSTHPFGAGWFDLSFPRLNPGENPVLHWARLVDLPLALVALPFIPSSGVTGAVLIASLIVPPLLFATLVFLMPAVARPLITKRHANLAALMLLFAPNITLNFIPGRADHHGYQIIFAALGLLALQRCLLCPRGWILAIVAAIGFAGALWISTEILPSLALFIAAIGMLGSWRGGFALRNAAVFGLMLPIAVALVVPLAMSPEEYASRTISWFSTADLIFATLAGAALMVGWLAGRMTTRPSLRFILMAAFGMCAGALYLQLVPDVLHGIYSGYAPINQLLADNTYEGLPMLEDIRLVPTDRSSYARAMPALMKAAYMSFLALGVIAWNLSRTRPQRRRLWLIHGVHVLPILLLTLFYEARLSWFMQLYSVVPAAWLIQAWWARIDGSVNGSRRTRDKVLAMLCAAPALIVALIVGLISVGGLLLTPLLPASAAAKIGPNISNALFFPVQQPKSSCPLLHARAFLDQNYRDRSLLILAGINEGPEIMFGTPFSVLAAPFNTTGNLDVYNFFSAHDEQRAAAIAAKTHADLVLVCKNDIPPFYKGLDTADKRAKARNGESSADLSFIERLTTGYVPSWLTVVEMPDDPNYLLFEVKAK